MDVKDNGRWQKNPFGGASKGRMRIKVGRRRRAARKRTRRRS